MDHRKVIVIGHSYFSKKISDDLNKISDQGAFFPIDNLTLAGKIKFFCMLPFVSTVYLIGAEYHRSVLVDVALWLGKKVVFHWVGTDVLKGEAFYKRGQKSKYAESVKHLCEVRWIQDELSLIGIQAEVVALLGLKGGMSERQNLPNQFKVLVYIGKNRPEFYGADEIFRIARALPNVQFVVIGHDSFENTPSNVTVRGWVKDMESVYAECSVYLRIPRHDGLAFSVLEALSKGLHVIYNYPHPGCLLATDESTITAQISELYDKHNSGLLEVNKVGQSAVLQMYDFTDVIGNLKNKLL